MTKRDHGAPKPANHKCRVIIAIITAIFYIEPDSSRYYLSANQTAWSIVAVN